MSTTEIAAVPEAVLLFPKAHDPAVSYAKGVVAGMSGSDYFKPLPAEVATLASDTEIYDAANVAARGGGRVVVAARRAARAKVIADLKHVRDRVQGVAETQTSLAEAAAVIVSAGMKVKRVVKRNKPPVRAGYGPTLGSVVLDARRVAKVAMNYWQHS